MIGWVSLFTTIAAAALLWGTDPAIVSYLSLAVMGASFATFCLAYDEPIKRARHRVDQRLANLQARGRDFEEFQRLQSAPIRTLPEDRKFRLTGLSALNLAAGIAGAGLCAWGVVLRIW